MYFYVNESEVGVNDSIFSGNEQQKVYLRKIFEERVEFLETKPTNANSFITFIYGPSKQS